MGRPKAMYCARLVLCLFCLGLSSTAQATPEWIWVKDERKSKIWAEFTQTFEVPEQIVSARLQAIADYASLRIRINDQPVEQSAAHGSLIDQDVSRYLLKGENLITLNAVSVGSAPAVALQLDLVDAKGKTKSLVTDKKWESAIGKARFSQPTATFGTLANEPWWNLPRLTLDSLDDYTQWKRASNAEKGTDPSTFQTVPGYEVDLLRSAGKDESSWVSLAFDPKGRVTIGREDKGLLRFSFSKDRSKIIQTETIEDSLKECRGLLYAHDALYANANNSKALYRLRDTNGNGKFDEVKSLYASEGGVGHGRNDLALGPDGKIYAIHGDSVRIPEDLSNSTSSLRRQRVPYRPNEGHVLRMDKDGKNIEVFCGGLRNPYGIAFNRHGEAFTYDADAENDMGTPWYRATEVKHLTSGADFGWRAVTGSWPPYYPDHPDNAQPSVQIGKGSPTSVKFGYQSNFPHAYQEALYVLDWTYGRILAVHLLERGAGYVGTSEVFLRGRPLNVTDLGFGPDGAMYFVTGGRRTQSALYRVRYVGPDVKPSPATTQQRARSELSKKARSLRRKLEFHHGKPSQEIDDDLLGDGSAGTLVVLWPHLGSPDPRIRYTARIALEHQPLKHWRSPALSEHGNPRIRLTAWTALMHAAPGQSSTILSRLTKLDLGSLEDDLILQAAHLYVLCLADGPGSSKEAILAQLRPLYPSQSAKLNWALAPLLIQLDPERAVHQTIALLKTCNAPLQTVHYLYQLRHANAGWTKADRETYFRKIGEATGYVGDSRGLPRTLGRIKKDALANVPESERKDCVALASSKRKMPPLPDFTGRKFVRNWKSSDFSKDLGFQHEERSLAKGKQMFALALCSRCHRFQGEGFPIGPDLTGVANRLGRKDLLQAIVSPSESIAQNYRGDVLKLTGGRTLNGQIIPTLDYRAPYLLLAENPLQPDQAKKIPKAEVLESKRSDLSIMPPGLLNNLSKQEVLDLLAYLESNRN
jgi:putative heme-binding domain-containing protein